MEVKEQRMYNVKDDQLIIHSEVIGDRYVKYESEFRSFNDVKFAEGYHASLVSATSTASNTMSDAFILQTQAKETGDVAEASEKLHSSLDIVVFFIKATFSADKNILREFRVKDLKSVSRNADAFIIFTRDLLVKVDKYMEALTAEGLKAEHMTTVNADLVALDKQRREQKDAIQSRPVITRDRIEKMNALYRILTELRDAAQIIFKTKPEVAALFDLPKPIRNVGEGVIEIVEEELVEAE